MTNKILAALTLVTIGLFIRPSTIMAQYGQYGQILGTQAPEVKVVHEPKNAGIEDYLNPKFFSMVSFSLSASMYALSKRKQKILSER